MRNIFKAALILIVFIMLSEMWYMVYEIIKISYNMLTRFESPIFMAMILFAIVGSYYWMKICVAIWKRK